MCGADKGINDCMNFLLHRLNVDLGDAVKMEVCMCGGKGGKRRCILLCMDLGVAFYNRLDGMME